MSNESATHLISITCACGFSPQEQPVKALTANEKESGLKGFTLEEWITLYEW